MKKLDIANPAVIKFEEEMVGMNNTVATAKNENKNEKEMVAMVEKMVIVETTMDEFVAFVMDESTGITHEIIDAELNKLGVKFNKNMRKEEKAKLWFEAATALVPQEPVETPAVGETPAAVKHKTNKEELRMKNEFIRKQIAGGLSIQEAEANWKMLNRAKADFDARHVRAEKYVNPEFAKLEDHLLGLARGYFRNLGEFRVEVLAVEFFGDRDRRKRWNRIGAITVRIPAGMMVISQWNQVERKFEPVPFETRSWSVFENSGKRQRFLPIPAGNGELTLAIEDVDGELFVRIPKSMGKDGNFYDIFRTRGVQFASYSAENNYVVSAALTAFIRLYAGELQVEHPRNRHNFSESCVNCRFAQFFNLKDGVMDDVVMEDRKSTTLFEAPDVAQLATYGSLIPQLYCPVKDMFVDLEAVRKANKAEEVDRSTPVAVTRQVGNDVRVEYRYLASDELLIDGRIIKKAAVRKEFTKHIAGECPHYHQNAYKGEERYMKEVVEKRETEGKRDVFVPKYWTDRAQAERIPVQVMVDGVWVTKFPGEVEAFEDVRILGMNGINVYPVGAVKEYMLQSKYIAPMEEFDVEKAKIMAKVRQIFQASWNIFRLIQEEGAEQLKAIIRMADNKPEIADRRLSALWDSAAERLRDAYRAALEGYVLGDIKPFARKFFAGKAEGAIPVNVQGFIDEFEWREEVGLTLETIGGTAIHYLDGITARDLAGRLDLYLNGDEAFHGMTVDDFIFAVMVEGKSFAITGENKHVVKLVADALQERLNDTLHAYTRALRKSEDAALEIAKLKVTREVKEYLREQTGLRK